MTETTTPKQRKGTILTDRICEKRAAKQVKIYDIPRSCQNPKILG